MIKLVQLNKNNFICISFLFFIFLNGTLNYSYAAEIRPEEIVNKYCIADLNGVRLSGNIYSAIKPLILWKNEPGWDSIFIANEVKIHDTKIISDIETHVEVRYHIVGILTGETLFDFDFTEVINFILVKKGEQWKIKGPIFPPHVALSSTKKHIAKLIQSSNTEDKTIIRKYKRIMERLNDMEKDNGE
jgi:hypothetical protein